MLSEKTKEEIKKLFPGYKNTRSACMVALQIVQREVGHLSAQDMREVAELVGVNPVQIEEVGAFYTMYNVERPVGRHHIQVCANLSCSLLGAEHIVSFIERRLNIKTGQTTPDGKFTLSTVECLGSCGTAPMMQVGDDYHENLTEDSVREILEGLK
ncbi:MAG: NADH-quinone oxidoreductase subunit NuoE [Deltaproteobacteria bacterium]|nr:NADH-quinone oxidoreductase subunit NuoE [Deltaproteobacteria bacterium]